MIKETIEKLKGIIAQSDTGHLPLSFRIELMKQVGDVLTVQKIMCECCKKACSVTGRQIMDNVHLLSRINEHLYRKRDSVEDIENEAEELWLHVQNNPDEATMTVSWAIVRLGYTVCYDAAPILEIEDYEGEDDDDRFDPESVNPDFIVSLVCSGGSPFSDNWKGDVEKRREYWNWYLDMILAMYENPQQEVIPFHAVNDRNTLHIPVPPGCDPALSGKIERLNSALDSYIHVPTDRKETERMKPYAEDSALVHIVADVIQGHSCIPSTPQEKEDYRITGIYRYDVIRFWYCVALLAQSPEGHARDCLSGLARTLMEQGPGELGILYRILLLLPEQEHLHGLTDELANYYRKIIPDLEAAKWLAEAGIPYPDTFEWSVSFRFTSNGETVLLSGNETERKAWFTLSVELFGPQALYGDYTRFTSYHIHVRNGDNSVHGHWNEKDGYLLRDNEYLIKDEHYTPKQLIILMHRLSGLGIRFSKVPADMSASRGISGKAVKEWIREMMEAYEHDSLEEVRDQALDIRKDEGDVGDTLNEIRKKWGEEMPVLKESHFDEIEMQYSCFSHEMGITALGQELTSYGYALYDLNGDDIYLLALVPQAEMQAFEEKCRKYGQYCKLLKQPRYDFGMKAKTIKLRKQMPRERMAWPDDGNRYITRGFAGYFAYGEWRQADVEKWQGTFVADLRVTPLQPVKQRKTKIKALLYSEELDFYAALSSYSKWTTFAVGGRNPLEADEWPRLSGLSLESLHEFRWCGHYLCMGDIHSATIFTMSSRGMKYESRFIFIDRMNYPPSFGIDGKGMPYIVPGEFSRSSVYRYEGNGKYYRMPFHMSGYDRFSSGCIPVPETSRLLLLGEYMARSNSGIWTEPGLLDLNMATQECRIAPLRMGDGSFRLREFYKEWVLVESRSNGNRTDYARLWNRKTDEVLRLRPGVLGNESFKSIHAMPDGTVIVNTLNKGDILYRAEDFWDFLRTASRPKKLGYWLNYPKPYPDREYELPPLSEDVTLMFAPPFVESQPTISSVAKPQPTRSVKTGPVEASGTQATDGIEITGGVLKINGQKAILPLSYTAMVQIFGKERIVTTHKTMQDDRGRTIQYDRRSFLVWDDAGVTAVRNEENAYNISAIYLQVKENKEPVSAIPAPTGIYGGEFIVDGIKWDRASDMTVCSGELEIASSASGGYMEITLAGSRDKRDTWQHYRVAMVENMQAALVERDRVRLMARNHPAGKPSDDQPDNATSLAQSCESFLTHSVNALHAGYSMGRSVRYLKTNLLPLLTEAAEKCSEYGSVRFSDLLSVYSGCVLLGYEKVNMKRFCEKLVKNGIRDFVFDTLTRCLVPEWDLTEDTVFPKIKEWIVSRHGNTTAPEAVTALKELSSISGNVLVVDAIMKI